MDDSIQGGAIPPVPTPVMGGGSAPHIGSNPMPSVTILGSLKGCLFYGEIHGIQIFSEDGRRISWENCVPMILNERYKRVK